MIPPIESGLSPGLAALVRATDGMPVDATQAAQARLLARMHSRRTVHRPARPWLALATSMAMAIVVVLVVSLFPPGSNAFAAVQRHFRDFRTLAMDVTQRHNGDVLRTSHTVVNADGVLRTDVGGQLSIIVDPVHGRVLTLLHDTRQAMLSEIPKGQRGRDDTLEWLDELRAFRGQATPIQEPRQIDGQAAQGWRVEVNGTTLELWADANGLPLSMRLPGDAGLEIDYRFAFDVALAEHTLASTPPSGYRWVESEAD